MENENDEIDYQSLMREGYSRGFKAWENSCAPLIDDMRESDNPQELWLNGIGDKGPVLTYVGEDSSHKKAIWWLEDKLGIGENDGWGDDYPTIEDFVISYEAGAYDVIMDNEYNPERVPFIADNEG